MALYSSKSHKNIYKKITKTLNCDINVNIKIKLLKLYKLKL